MAALSETTFSSGKCPECGKKSLAPIAWAFGPGKPTFRCTACDAQLTTGVKWPLFAGIPLSLLVVPLAAWLSKAITQTFQLSGATESICEALIFGPSAALVLTVMFSGVVYRRWQPKE